MNPKRDLEQRIVDYYATEAPSRAPGWLLARAFDTIDTTRQRRIVFGRPWRIPLMNSVAKLGQAAVAIVAVGLVALTLVLIPAVGPGVARSPEPSSSSASSPPPSTERFDSTVHGISIDYPSGWQIRPATEPWNHDAVTFDSPAVDVIFDPSAPAGLYLALVSESLDDQTSDDWAYGEAITASEVCQGGSGFGRITLNGARGWIKDCKFDAPTTQVVSVATSTRGYVIVLRVPDEPRYAIYGYEGDYFERLIQTVEFHPEDAVDAESAP